MKIRVSPLLLGSFIIGAIAIVFALLIFLGHISLFHKVGRFVFYLQRSNQGVDEGSAVNLDGVRVGEVEHLHVYFDQNTHQSIVAVICRIDQNVLTDLQGRVIKLTDRQTLTNLISEGLFVQVQATGLIGAKYVELGFEPKSRPVSFSDLPASSLPVIPTVASAMSKLSGDVSGVLSNLKQIDIKGLMKQVNGVIASARGQLDELGTNHLTDHVSSAAESFGNLMKSPELHGAVERIQGAAANLQILETNLNAQVEPACTNLEATLTSAKASVQELHDFLGSRSQLGEQTQELLQQLNQTARSIQQLSDFLQRHPNALISGRTGQNQ